MQWITTWLRRRWPREIDDPDLVRLSYDLGRWTTNVTRDGRNILVVINAVGWRRDDSELRRFATQVLSDLPARERSARQFVTANDPCARWGEISLGAITVFRASKGWIRLSLSRSKPEAAGLVTTGRALSCLQFGIPNDLNVLDVIFLGDRPVELDYH